MSRIRKDTIVLERIKALIAEKLEAARKLIADYNAKNNIGE